MSRYTQVLNPDEAEFLRGPDSPENPDETFIVNINESEYENQDEDVNVGGEEDGEEEDEEEEDEEEEEDVNDEEENDENKPGPVEQKLKIMSQEEINELISQLELEEPASCEEDDGFEVEDDGPKVKNIQEKKKKEKHAPPKQGKKPTTKANKQGKKELIPEKESKNIEESKSKKGKNKKAEPIKEENITDDVPHPPNSVDHNAETKQKKIRNKKQHLEEEAMTSYLPTEKEELPPKKNRGKKQESSDAHENNSLAISSKYASDANEDSKSRKTRKGKVEQSHKEESSEGTKKQNKAEEAASTNSQDNSKQNKAKIKSDKDKSKVVDNFEVKEAEPKVSANKPEKAGKSVKGKQKNTTSDLKINKGDGMKKDDTEIKENINERPKRNITKKVYTAGKDVATVPKVKKETKVERPLQIAHNESQIGSAPVDKEKTKPQQKGKKNTEVKEKRAINKVETVKKPVSRNK